MQKNARFIKKYEDNMEKTPLTPQQRQFLINYAQSLDTRQSAQKAGYKAPGGITQAEKLLKNPHHRAQLDAITEEKALKYDICKAYVVKKYLEIMRGALSPKNSESAPQDAALALRALDSMARTLGIFAPENARTDECGMLKNIIGLDTQRI